MKKEKLLLTEFLWYLSLLPSMDSPSRLLLKPLFRERKRILVTCPTDSGTILSATKMTTRLYF